MVCIFQSQSSHIGSIVGTNGILAERYSVFYPLPRFGLSSIRLYICIWSDMLCFDSFDVVKQVQVRGQNDASEKLESKNKWIDDVILPIK